MLGFILYMWIFAVIFIGGFLVLYNKIGEY